MNLGKRRNLDFSFTDVPVSGIKSPATVSFVKNYFEIKIEGIEKPLKHKNLGKLLYSKK